MASIEAVLFIDANQYLDLYRRVSGKMLLEAIIEQQEYIFVTEQVADEVQRNKVEIAAMFFKDQFKKLEMSNIGLPDHFFGKEIRANLQEIHNTIKETKNELIQCACNVLGQISRSEDEVSKALASIFARATRHNEDELQRAKVRKERGKSPGKKTDPLGDQLSWEQILSRCGAESKLWIISSDNDFATEYEGRVFLNAALYQDVSQPCQRVPEVYCFGSILDGIKDFAEKTRVKADKLPRGAEAEQIKKEQESLPPLGQMTGQHYVLVAETGSYGHSVSHSDVRGKATLTVKENENDGVA